MADYYGILGVEKEASCDEIKRAYRKLSFKFHPDKNEGDEFFEHMFLQLQEAYTTLSDPSKRAEYDLELAHAFSIDRTDYSQTSTLEPVIDKFEVDKNTFYEGEELIFSWDTSNANSVALEPFGFVPIKGEKRIRMHPGAKTLLPVTLVAINTTISRFASQEITLRHKYFHPQKTDKQTAIEENFWTIQGRIRRRVYVGRSFLLGIPIFIFGFAMFQARYTADSPNSSSFLSIIGALAVVCLILAVIQSIKRLHDINMNGWWSVGLFVPIMNIFLAFFLLFYRGNEHANNYGVNPRELADKSSEGE